MWLLIPEGFFSIVQKEDEKELCVRARVGADLDRLRQTYLPTLGETVETTRTRGWLHDGYTFGPGGDFQSGVAVAPFLPVARRENSPV